MTGIAADYRELVLEFLTLPEFSTNMNDFNKSAPSFG
jgi:hypothetical protein